MPGERPGIVQGPDDRCIHLRKVIEQDFDIQVIAMNIVHANHIGLQCLNLLHQFFGCPARTKTVAIQQGRFQSVHHHVQLPTDLDQLRLAGAITPAVGDIALMAMLQHDLPNVFGDAAGTTGVDGGV